MYMDQFSQPPPPPCVAKLGHECAYVWTHKRSQVNVPVSGHKAKASSYLERAADESENSGRRSFLSLSQM